MVLHMDAAAELAGVDVRYVWIDLGKADVFMERAVQDPDRRCSELLRGLERLAGAAPAAGPVAGPVAEEDAR
jgi:hypothetical protein